LYDRLDLHLTEASASARAAQPDTLGSAVGRLAASSPELPAAFDGVLYANELLDAMPVHQVVMRKTGLREVYVEPDGDTLTTVEDAPSSPALEEYLRDAGVTLEPGWKVEISLSAVEWTRNAARRMGCGFMLLIDYGHEARELYSVTHATGTLTTFSQHQAAGSESAGGKRPAWLLRPGDQDLTAHVDFTSVRKAAEAEGFVTLGLLDQTYFLMGVAGLGNPSNLDPSKAFNLSTPVLARAFRTLTFPGGLGSTMKVLILAKNMGTPSLVGCSYRVRLT
jgi:SAM-dependent MidA family methyltransferase